MSVSCLSVCRAVIQSQAVCLSVSLSVSVCLSVYHLSGRQSVSKLSRQTGSRVPFRFSPYRHAPLTLLFTLLFECFTQEATRLGHYVKNKDGGEYENWCWPGKYTATLQV